MHTPINWFEIPTTDFERGIRFYETVLEVSLKREDMGPVRLAVFPYADLPVSGAVIHYQGEGAQPPGPMGTMIYLNGGDDLAVPLARVQPAGGSILIGKTLISPEIGYFAVFKDCEGNHVGLYSMH